MATIIVSFPSEKDAQEAVRRLSQANLGEVRARVLDSSQPMSFPKTNSTSPMITPELGSVEVRPTESPSTPASMNEGEAADESAVIPTTGSGHQDIQVEIVVDEASEEQIRQIMGIPG